VKTKTNQPNQIEITVVLFSVVFTEQCAFGGVEDGDASVEGLDNVFSAHLMNVAQIVVAVHVQLALVALLQVVNKMKENSARKTGAKRASLASVCGNLRCSILLKTTNKQNKKI
jgi:hypothetical protein